MAELPRPDLGAAAEHADGAMARGTQLRGNGAGRGSDGAEPCGVVLQLMGRRVERQAEKDGEGRRRLGDTEECPQN